MHNNVSGMHNSRGLISYDVKPSPRAQGEFDVKSYVQNLQEMLANCRMELKQYQKLIETYRSEIVSMQAHLETLNNDNLKQVVPVVQHDTEFFNQAMQNQR